MPKTETRKRWNSTFKVKPRKSAPESPRRGFGLRTAPLAPSSPQALKTGTLARSKTLNPIGKKGSEWIAVRKALKKLFNWAGITACELRFQGCYYNEQLSFCHCKKRRKLEEGEIWHVVLGCLRCHSRLDEQMSHAEMHAKVHSIIEKRGLLLPEKVKQSNVSNSTCQLSS